MDAQTVELNEIDRSYPGALGPAYMGCDDPCCQAEWVCYWWCICSLCQSRRQEGNSGTYWSSSRRPFDYMQIALQEEFGD